MSQEPLTPWAVLGASGTMTGIWLLVLRDNSGIQLCSGPGQGLELGTSGRQVGGQAGRQAVKADLDGQV